MGAGLTFLFDPLLVDFLRENQLHICQLTPNAVRVVLGIAEFNRRFNLALGLNEIKYYYSLRLYKDK